MDQILLLPNAVGKKLSSESERQPGDHEANEAVSYVQPLDTGVVLQSLEGVSNLKHFSFTMVYCIFIVLTTPF